MKSSRYLAERIRGSVDDGAEESDPVPQWAWRPFDEFRKAANLTSSTVSTEMLVGDLNLGMESESAKNIASQPLYLSAAL